MPARRWRDSVRPTGGTPAARQTLISRKGLASFMP
jgi:hypothetical protein